MKRLRSIHLRRWIPALFLGSMLLGALLIFAIALWIGFQDIEKDSHEEIRGISNQLQLPLRRALEQQPPEPLPPLISTVTIRPNVEMVAITDETGKVIAASRYAWVGRKLSQVLPASLYRTLPKRGDSLAIVKTPNGYLGREIINYLTTEAGIRTPRHVALWIALDTRHIRHQTLREALTIASVLVATGLTIAALLLYLTRRYVTQPFGTLAHFAQRLAAGNLNERLRIHGEGEAATLATALHDMAERIGNNINTLHENENRLSVTLDSIGDAVMVTDDRGLVIRMNPEAERMTGWREEDAVGRPLTEVFHIIHAVTREPAIDPVARVLREGRVVGLANHTALLSKDKKEYQIADSAAPIRGPDGNILGVILVFHDVTETYAAQARLSNLSRQLQDITRALPDPMFILSRDGKYLQIHGGSEELLAQTREALLGKRIDQVMPPEQADAILTTIRNTLESGKSQLLEYELDVGTGKRFFEGHCAPFHLDGQEAVVWLARDITRRKQAEQDAIRLALYDPLTGLPNRRMFHERLEQAVARARRIQEKGALLFIDFDNFKTINDSLGHVFGDRVLQEIARRIRPILRLEDLACRLGGDEFVVLLEDLGGDRVKASERAETVARKLQTAFNEPLNVDGEILHLQFSAGIVLFPDGVSSEELIKRADIAMYRAKETGKNRICFYSKEFQTIAEERLRIQRELLQGIETGQLTLYVQPHVDPKGHWRGGEVLVRWQHPQRGLLLPAAFVPVAEESGLIARLDQWVLSQTIAGLADQALPESFNGLSVNLSGPLMLEPDFPSDVEAWLTNTGLEAHHLELEITERLLLDDQGNAAKVINGLRDLGMRFAVDDFGTGYSSLRYLQRLPLDRLKIDRSFVTRLPDHSSDTAIVETILAMARHLELDVVAEGVERLDQQEFLMERGCRRFQGFLHARPMPWDEFFARLGERIAPPEEA